MSGGRRYYRLLSPAERARTHEVMPTLIRAGCKARRDGWRLPYEKDWLWAEGRRLGVWIWPALADQVCWTAMHLEAAS